MGILKKLAGQTAYYGLSSMLGRLLNFLLVPLYTNEITPPSRMGIVAFLYALAALFNVFLSYGMETAFFRYSSDGKYGKKTVASTAFTSLFISTTLFMVLGLLFYRQAAEAVGYADMSLCVLYFVLITAFDAYAIVPFAQLRLENKAVRPCRYRAEHSAQPAADTRIAAYWRDRTPGGEHIPVQCTVQRVGYAHSLGTGPRHTS